MLPCFWKEELERLVSCMNISLCIFYASNWVFTVTQDPDGVNQKNRKRLRRRVYGNPGPDCTCYMYSCDEQKPYGICINGCIDRYSKSIDWLYVFNTNSGPAVIATVISWMLFFRYDDSDEFLKRHSHMGLAIITKVPRRDGHI